MIRSRFGVKALGLCALVLGLMAFGSTIAHAEVNSYWGYKSGMLLPKFGAALEPGLETALENNHGALLTKIAGAAVEILCTAITAVNMKLKAEGKVLGKLKFHGCRIKLNGVESKACEPSEGGSKGLIETVTLEGLIRLHLLGDGVRDETVLFKRDPIQAEKLEIMATVKTGEECALGEAIPIGGKFSVKDCEGVNGTAFLTHKLIHLAEAFAPLTYLWAISDTVEHRATLDGSVLVGLLAPHANLEWAGTPN
jgi:hypothetical protein